MRETPLLAEFKNLDKDEDLLSDEKLDNLKSFPESSKNNLSASLENPINPIYSL